MTDVLSAGLTHSLTQNTIYALPSKRVGVYADLVLEVSNTTATTGFVRVTATTTGTELVASFVRCTTANTLVTVKGA